MSKDYQISSRGIPVHDCPTRSRSTLAVKHDSDSISTEKSTASWYGSSPMRRRSWISSVSFRSSSSLDILSDPNSLQTSQQEPLQGSQSRPQAQARPHSRAKQRPPSNPPTSKPWNRRSAVAGAMNPSHWGDRDYMKCVTFSKTKDHMRWTPLHYAAKKGLATAADQLANDGVPLEARSTDSQTALHIACAEGHLNVVEVLIKHHASLTAEDKESRTPIAVAAEKSRLDICVALFKADGDKKHFEQEKSRLLSAAVYNSDKVNLRMLLDCFCDPNMTAGGPRPLRVAVEKGDLEIVSILLKSGADPSLKSVDGSLPLATAVLKRSAQTVRLLVAHGADPFATSSHGKSPFKIALEREDKEMIRLLMKQDVDFSFGQGSSYNKMSMLAMAIDCNNSGAVRSLLENGADPSAPEDDGSTPLIRAAFPEKLEVLDILLTHGAIVDAPDKRGILPVQSVVFRAARRLQAIRSGNADQQAAVDNEKSIIEVLQLLMQYGADLHSADANGKNLLHLCAEAGLKRIALFCLSNRFDINGGDRNGWAALHWAAYGGDQATAQVLKLRGADVDLVDESGLSPLLIACKYSRNEVAILLSPSSNLNHRDDSGRSALSYAASSENILLVEFLLSKGAMAFERDYNVSAASAPASPGVDHSASNGGDFSDAIRSSEICKLGATCELQQSHRLPSPSNLKRLLSLGAPANSKVNESPLACLAAVGPSAEAMKVLMQCKADIHATDPDGQTPLHIAASHGQREILDILLAAGADINRKDMLNRTPEEAATAAGESECSSVLVAATWKQDIVPVSPMAHKNRSISKHKISHSDVPASHPSKEVEELGKLGMLRLPSRSSSRSSNVPSLSQKSHASQRLSPAAPRTAASKESMISAASTANPQSTTPRSRSRLHNIVHGHSHKESHDQTQKPSGATTGILKNANVEKNAAKKKDAYIDMAMGV